MRESTRGGSTKKRATPAAVRNFTAAVRYGDGRSELLRVRNAGDLDAARRLVLDNVLDVRTLVLAESRHALDE